ncbi:MAG: SpoIID/LytB domain-containing protein [Actinomycetota bacterium]
MTRRRRGAALGLALILSCALLGTLLGAPRAADAQVPAGRIRLIPDNDTASFRVRATYPPKPEECPVNQPRPLEAAYPGMLEIGRRADGKLFLVTELTFPRYLKGIAEVPLNWPMESLKTQVVAARTYAMAHLNPSTAEAKELGYDLCSTDACQVYRGLQVERGAWGDEWAKAVDATTGEILEHNGKPATTFYFSTSNGKTYTNTEVFGGTALPYLKPVTENDDKGSPTSSWSVRMPLTDLAAALRLAGTWSGGAIESVRLEDGKVTYSGGGKSETRDVDAFRRQLNKHALCLEPKRYPTPATSGKGNLPQVVPSKWMTIRQEGDAIVMEGRGWGHGVGMVQWGAKGKADRGMTYDEILATYYGGLRPTKTTEPGRIRVLLAKDIQELTIEPTGAVHAEGTTLRGGPLVIRGGPTMSVSPASPIAPVLTVGAVESNGEAAPGSPATFMFELSASANVALRWQAPDGTQAESPPEPRERGPQTLTWDAVAAGLPPGTHEAVIVADNGVDQVFSAAQEVTIPSPTPSPEPSPAAEAAGEGTSGSPGWLPVVAGGAGIVVVAVVALVLVRRRPGRHGA